MTGAPSEPAPTATSPLVVDRYAIYDAIASGGMATVHLGRLIGTAGFLRTVAIKRLHSQFANNPEFTGMFLDEARLASRIQHPNVVSTLDVVRKDHELLLVMEYVRGESLSRLVRRARDGNVRLPPKVVVAIMSNALHGLHAAHDALDEKGQPLGLVHRDMSPHNILVGIDGVSRVLDFGVAKAAGRVHTTKDGDIKGKLLYMAPEQLAAENLDRTADVYAMGVVLFESLTSVRMFAGENETAAITKIITNDVRVPSEIDPLLKAFDPIVRRATSKAASQRYPTARDMARELESLCGPPASPAEVAEWVQHLASETLDERARMVAEIERSSTRSKPPLPPDSSRLIDHSNEATVSSVSAMSAARMPIGEPKSGTQPALVSPISPEPAPGGFTGPVKVGIALLSLLLVVSLVAVAYLLMLKPPPPTAATAPTVSVTPPPAAPTDEAAPKASATVVQRPGTSASAATPSAPSASAAPRASATATATGTQRTFKPAVNCDPPWVVDKNGHRHFIPECMK